MKNGVVSVVVTTYKRKPEIVIRSIKSVCEQTYRNIEIYVVDDSPAEYPLRKDVAKAIEEIGDARLVYIQNEENIGACASRNKAIGMSEGEFVMYVDDDDELLLDCIEKRVEKISNSDAGLVYSDCYVNDEEKGELKQTTQAKRRGFVYDKLILENFIFAFPTFRRECIENCGGFDVEMPAAQDYELWLRIAKKYKVDYIDEPQSIVHLHNEERISTNWKRKARGLELLAEKNSEHLKKHPYAKHIRLLKLVPFYVKAGEKKKARKTLVKAVLICPFDILENLRYLKSYFVSRKKK